MRGEISVEKFNLDLTLLGGQAFTYNKIGIDEYEGYTSKVYIYLKRLDDNRLQYELISGTSLTSGYLLEYLDVQTNYISLISRITKDKNVARYVDMLGVVRLLKQDFQDTLIGFMLATNKSIKGIRRAIQLISKEYGREVVLNEGLTNERIVYLLPRIEDIASKGIDGLIRSGAGYRAEYIYEMSKLYADGYFDGIDLLDEESAREKLKRLKGIGDKVSDCILVYGLHFENVFPLDVWGKRILDDLYNKKGSYADLRGWCKDYFSGYGSLAGQYLFEGYRGRKLW